MADEVVARVLPPFILRLVAECVREMPFEAYRDHGLVVFNALMRRANELASTRERAAAPDAPADISRLDPSAIHIERIRRKTSTAEGLGPFWRGILLGALATIDWQRKMTDVYGIGLLMIREGCIEPAKVAGEALSKGTFATPAPLATPIDTTAPDEQKWDARAWLEKYYFGWEVRDFTGFHIEEMLNAAYTAGRLSRGMELPEEVPEWFVGWVDAHATRECRSSWEKLRQRLSGGGTWVR